jgi:hypothetical protein
MIPPNMCSKMLAGKFHQNTMVKLVPNKCGTQNPK